MALLARSVVPGIPHHVIARGNRREPIFFEDGDQELYGDLLGEHRRQARVSVWAYCLMPNYVQSRVRRHPRGRDQGATARKRRVHHGLERILGRPIAKRALGRKSKAIGSEQMALL